MLGKAPLVVAGFGTAALGHQILRTIRHVRPEIVPRGKKLASNVELSEISIVSYNMLCARFATPEDLPHVSPSYLEYDYRWPILQQEIQDFGSDILCLQEVTHERWDELRSFMAELGYGSIVQHKPHDMLLAVFWRASRFSMRWSEERSRALMVELKVLNAEQQPPEHEQQLCDFEKQQGDGSHAPQGNASRQNGCTSAADVDESRNGSDERSQQQRGALYVINVHLEASPDRPGDRVNQMRHALHRLQYHLQTRGVPPETANLVVAGDFNSQAGHAPCRLLRTGALPAGTTEDHLPHVPVTQEAVEHPFKLQEVYEEAHAVPPFTHSGGQPGTRLDFLWCTAGIDVAAVLRPLPTALQDLVQRSGMPNMALPSDHLPIGAVLRLALGREQAAPC